MKRTNNNNKIFQCIKKETEPSNVRLCVIMVCKNWVGSSCPFSKCWKLLSNPCYALLENPYQRINPSTQLFYLGWDPRLQVS